MKKLLQAVPIALMWMPSEPSLYQVKVYRATNIVRSVSSTNSFLMLDELMTGLDAGNYQVTMQSGTNTFTNAVTYPFVDEPLKPLQRPAGFHISSP